MSKLFRYIGEDVTEKRWLMWLLWTSAIINTTLDLINIILKLGGR